jgi:hypothetical protein
MKGRTVTEFEEFQLMLPAAFLYTVPVLVNYQAGSDDMGAGVLIEVGNRLFVATAAHIIEEKPRVVPDAFSMPAQDDDTGIVRRGIHPDPELDLGFLELEQNDRMKAICRASCSLEQVYLGKPPEPAGPMLHVVGFPVAARRLTRRGCEVEKRLLGSHFARQTDNHYYLSYPEKGWRITATTEEEFPFYPSPKGFSGSGLWGFNQSGTDELFSPQRHIRLYGIQCSWLSADRLVKCVRMLPWFRLIATEYPDLKPMLASAFPSL